MHSRYCDVVNYLCFIRFRTLDTSNLTLLLVIKWIEESWSNFKEKRKYRQVRMNFFIGLEIVHFLKLPHLLDWQKLQYINVIVDWKCIATAKYNWKKSLHSAASDRQLYEVKYNKTDWQIHKERERNKE